MRAIIIVSIVFAKLKRGMAWQGLRDSLYDFSVSVLPLNANSPLVFINALHHFKLTRCLIFYVDAPRISRGTLASSKKVEHLIYFVNYSLI